jgi:hypothetical protein
MELQILNSSKESCNNNFQIRIELCVHFYVLVCLFIYLFIHILLKLSHYNDVPLFIFIHDILQLPYPLYQMNPSITIYIYIYIILLFDNGLGDGGNGIFNYFN